MGLGGWEKELLSWGVEGKEPRPRKEMIHCAGLGYTHTAGGADNGLALGFIRDLGPSSPPFSAHQTCHPVPGPGRSQGQDAGLMDLPGVGSHQLALSVARVAPFPCASLASRPHEEELAPPPTRLPTPAETLEPGDDRALFNQLRLM